MFNGGRKWGSGNVWSGFDAVGDSAKVSGSPIMANVMRGMTAEAAHGSWVDIDFSTTWSHAGWW